MGSSLLAHLYSRIRGSQEDVATLALQYILTQSERLNSAFTKLAEYRLGIVLPEKLIYTCQESGENKERPDMSGRDNNGNEIILCEMKFYAGLTSNQPLGYIDRLKEENGKGLVFICPSVRTINLWNKISNICAQRETKQINNGCICTDGIHITILTWAEVIEVLHSTAASVAPELIADIQQLKGFCDLIDSEAFIPFTSQDLSAGCAVMMDRYYRVIDGVYDLIAADKSISTGVIGKASPYVSGYERKLIVNDTLVFFSFDRAMWKNNNCMETPFWVAIGNSEYQQSSSFQKFLKSIDERKIAHSYYGRMTYFALDVMTDAALDDVCSDLKNQILNYLKLVQNVIE